MNVNRLNREELLRTILSKNLITNEIDLLNLTQIDLSRHEITSIDKDTFNNLTNLTHIYLYDNKITSIDKDAFKGLSNLTHIDLSLNEITSIDKDTFNNLTNLTHIYFFSNKIASIDKNTFNNLTNLTHIYFFSNKIASIDKDTFNNLTNLTQINLSNNEITSIDKDTFNNLTNLTHIYLYDNKITSIDKDAFKGLSNLTHIDLSLNEITSIDKDTFNNLTNLTHIYFFSNKIASIDKNTFNNLTNLTHIYFFSNKIASIDKNTFNNLTNLTHIDLRNNKITSIDKETFNNLTNLVYIDLSSNKIKSIDKDTFNNLTNLAYINLSWNEITSIDKDTFNGLTNLSEIYLHPLSNRIDSNIFNGMNDVKKLTLFDEKVINNPNFKVNQEISKENINLFFGKTIKIKSTGLSLNFTRNSLNLINLEEDEWKCYKKPFKWENIPDKLSVLIGKNGTGKTSLLKLINDSINSEENKDKSFISKYYFCSNDLLFKQYVNDDELLLLKNIDNNDKEKKDNILDNFYDSINEFSVIQYFDFLILKDYLTDNTQISRYQCQKINKRKEQLLRKKYSDLNINIEYYLTNNSKDYKLSPGEYLIVLIELWRIHAKKQKEINEIEKRPINNKLRILLLDEPDAHMHPSLIKEFIDLISSNDLDYLNLQVIITTHNPITVSLTPIENLFELKRDSNNHLNLTKIKNKKTAILSLTEHLISVDLPIRLVFVEATDDKLFYELLHNYLLKIKFNFNITGEFRLLFIAGVTSEKKDSCKTFVKGIVEKCVNHGKIEHMFGIVDKDNDINEKKANIQVLKRYSLENYLFDPINIYLYLLLNKIESNEIQTNIKINTPECLFQLDKDNLKTFYEDILNDFKNKLDPNDSYKETTQVEFCYNFSENSKDIFLVKYPNFFIKHHGHGCKDGTRNGLKELITEKYLNIPKDNKEIIDFLNEIITKNYNYLRLIPFELIQIFIDIQNPDYSIINKDKENEKIRGKKGNDIEKIKKDLSNILKNKNIDGLQDVCNYLEKNINSIENSELIKQLYDKVNKSLVNYYGKYYSSAKKELNKLIDDCLEEIKNYTETNNI
jgi:Leucine-rich repeat (LRR) protein/energy-coupling factor transporter ATP-binding protein EcfA2